MTDVLTGPTPVDEDRKRLRVGRADCSRCGAALDGAHKSYCLSCQRAYNQRYRKPPKPPRPLVHNRSGYNRGCRCMTCRDANNDYWRQWTRGETDKRSVPPHGTNARYTAGCRCGECGDARRLYRQFLSPLSLEELRHGRVMSSSVSFLGTGYLNEWYDPTSEEALARLVPTFDLCGTCGLATGECKHRSGELR